MESGTVSGQGEVGGTGGDILERQAVENSSRNIEGVAFCDACPMCPDVCDSKVCQKCDSKRRSVSVTSPSCKYSYTMCEVRRHNRREDCWLVAHDRVYDATTFIGSHPAGPDPILLRAGKDVTVDYDFHSTMSQRTYWKPLLIGKLAQCPRHGSSQFLPCTIQ